MTEKICLTGGSGFLSWAFIEKVLPERLFLPLRQRSPALPNAKIFESFADVDWGQHFKNERVVGVINTAAMSNPVECHAHPEQSHWVNVEWPLYLGQLCRERSIPCVHFSSDLVFDGQADLYGDQAQANPLSLYGEQKAEVEKRLPEIYPESWICRLPLLFGESGVGSKNGWASWIEKAHSGLKQPLFVDEFRSAIRTSRVADFVLSRLGELSGVMNVGGPKGISRYEMGEAVCDVFDLNSSCISPSSLEELNLSPPRPPRLILDSSQAESEGFESLSFKEELLEIQKGGGWLREPS